MDTSREFLERCIELYNAGDLDGYMELYAEDAVQTMAEGITFRGRGEIRERLARELVGFPDATYTIGGFVQDGDAFADEFVFEGTHTGPFPLPDGTELPPTGKRVQIRGMEFVQMRDGKIAVDNLYWDNLSALAQLGLVPQGAIA